MLHKGLGTMPDTNEKSLADGQQGFFVGMAGLELSISCIS
jgi:hypothetical protein